MREHVQRCAAFQRIDALVKHADLDHELRYGELMPLANSGQTVFERLRGREDGIANTIAILAGRLAQGP
jgi:hypothetical protein